MGLSIRKDRTIPEDMVLEMLLRRIQVVLLLQVNLPLVPLVLLPRQVVGVLDSGLEPGSALLVHICSTIGTALRMTMIGSENAGVPTAEQAPALGEGRTIMTLTDTSTITMTVEKAALVLVRCGRALVMAGQMSGSCIVG